MNPMSFAMSPVIGWIKEKHDRTYSLKQTQFKGYLNTV